MSDQQIHLIMDNESLTLIIQLQQEDVMELLRADERMTKVDIVTDSRMALETYNQHLDNLKTVFGDQSMAGDSAQALLRDDDAHTDATDQRFLVRVDPALRSQLSSERLSSETLKFRDPIVITEAGIVNEGIFARLTALRWRMWISGTRHQTLRMFKRIRLWFTMKLRHISRLALRSSDSSTMLRDCTACGNNSLCTKSFKAPCSHIYCITCLSTLFEQAITDESLFPPRCCRQQIPLASVKVHLDEALYTKLEVKSVEFSATNGVYCFDPFCSTFITSADLGLDQAKCGHCNKVTCTICKGVAHGGNCPEDTNTQAVLGIARQEGRQRCEGCHRVIELGIGCNHMTYAHTAAKVVMQPC